MYSDYVCIFNENNREEGEIKIQKCLISNES